jgi:hypothetical protein
MKKILALALGLAALSGCSSKMEAAYKSCVARQTEKLLKQGESAPAALQETLATEGPKLAEATCAPIKAVCKDDFESTMCQQVVASMTR